MFQKNLSKPSSRVVSDFKNSSRNPGSNQTFKLTASSKDEEPHTLIGKSSKNLYNGSHSQRNFKLKPSSSFGDSNLGFENKGLYQISIENISEASMAILNKDPKTHFESKDINIYNRQPQADQNAYNSQFKVRDVEELSQESEDDRQGGTQESIEMVENISGHVNQKAELQYGSYHTRSKTKQQQQSPMGPFKAKKRVQNINRTSINIESEQNSPQKEPQIYSIPESPLRQNSEALPKIYKFETPNAVKQEQEKPPNLQSKKKNALSKKSKPKNSLKEKLRLKNKLGTKTKEITFTPKENFKYNVNNAPNSVPALPNPMINPLNGGYFPNSFVNMQSNRQQNPYNMGYYQNQNQNHYPNVTPVNQVLPVVNQNDGNHILYMRKRESRGQLAS